MSEEDQCDEKVWIVRWNWDDAFGEQTLHSSLISAMNEASVIDRDETVDVYECNMKKVHSA